ncbi:protein of unknown function [uncultured Woeseiaceae bacterium]|uniref:Bacterial transcriptional activator domain-containing protein n=1 Tax=uncultured Woeseiaceae bacterium TaxID=1983305 RepID=A0A7D9H6K9_9GAMM|nr:protein of unknown function [uncultured Woeseiaceae bacterium]
MAWLSIEVSATTFPMLNLPDWAAILVTVLLLIGFPIAIIFAWAFELTPEGLKKEKDVDRSESITHVTGRKLDFIIIGVLVVALAVFAVERFVLLPERAPAIDAPNEIIATEVQQSIAVLPFVNMSSDPEQEYFSDGLSEEILNLLAKIPELKVIGRTSSFAFKGKNEDLRIIGEALGVKTVLEGSVRKSGNEVRITAQLIDVTDASHIWSETYDRTLDDIFAVQDDVAAAIIDAMQIHVGVNPTRGRPTENTEAYALYLKARASFFSPESEKLLREAVELDPMFAEALELLAFKYWTQAGAQLETAEAAKLMGETAAQALAIDPDLVLAQAIYQSGNPGSYSHLGEIEALERVVREDPSNFWALDALFFDLMEVGYINEAVGVAERFVDLEPLSPRAYARLTDALYAVGRTSESVAALEVIEQLYPDGHYQFGWRNLMDQRDEIAIAHYEAGLEQDGLPSNWVRELVIGARDPATGQAYLDRRIPQIVASLGEEDAILWNWRLTDWYLFFGFLDRHFEVILAGELTDSTWTDAGNLVFTGTIARRLGFTAHPKYLEVAEATGIIDVWEQRGPPDFCEKVDGKWVCE